MKFGKWTVLERGKSRRGRSYWICVCECNPINKVEVAGQNLRSGKSKSCGCVLNKDYSRDDGCIKNKNKTKSNKKRKRILLEFNGETKTLTEWAKITGIRYDTLLKRFKKNMKPKDILRKENETRFIDIIGNKYNKLTVVDRAENDKHGTAQWWCKCDCENKNLVKVRTNSLKRGKTKSCGCLYKEIERTGNTSHGLSNHRLYEIWCGMKKRCNNEKSPQFNDYGGRGINVCQEWEESFESFYKWAMENGYDDSLTIERINNDIGYNPNNCKWATRKEQNRNKRNNIKIKINGMDKMLIELSEEYGISLHKLRERYHNGVSVKDLLKP